MITTINYQKRKNIELFNEFESHDSLFLSDTQNYIPIYTRFFNLNETNYNTINLNHKWYITSIKKNIDEMDNLYKCKIRDIETNKSKDREVFFKMAPLLDPFKYMVGKYNFQDPSLFKLPKFGSTTENCNAKLLDTNNSAYVDGLFLFLSSQLKHSYKFVHGVDYYGSYLAIKNNFKLNVFDDIDYLNSSEFFNKNKGTLFHVDDYEHLFHDNDKDKKLKPLTIGKDVSSKSHLSIKSFDNEIFEDVFEGTFEETNNNTTTIDFNDLKDMEIDLVDITNTRVINTDLDVTLKSNSTCSSRSSYTNDDDQDTECENCDDSSKSFQSISSKKERKIDTENDTENNSNSEESEWEDEDDSNKSDGNDEDSYEEELINVTIPKFPVQVISMENCGTTFDELIENEDMPNDEWFSALMQIIMILICYQKAFQFTHNDLHTNNVMYIPTDKKYIFYCYKKKYYKVPTFGRLFKIIDFGRSIFKFDGKLFCSDSFQPGGDAATQYNVEPYFNDKKPRLEPNFSFDLCRLACSIFDVVMDDFEEMRDLSKITDPVKRIIFEWCLDDKGINMLYKNNGTERYPDFKLYKMIARCVHNHIPQAQLERPEFDAFSKFTGDIKSGDTVVDIDVIPSYI